MDISYQLLKCNIKEKDRIKLITAYQGKNGFILNFLLSVFFFKNSCLEWTCVDPLSLLDLSFFENGTFETDGKCRLGIDIFIRQNFQ